MSAKCSVKKCKKRDGLILCSFKEGEMACGKFIHKTPCYEQMLRAHALSPVTNAEEKEFVVCGKRCHGRVDKQVNKKPKAKKVM